MAEVDPIILKFETEGLTNSQTQLKQTAEGVVNLTNAISSMQTEMAGLDKESARYKTLQKEVQATTSVFNTLSETQESLGSEYRKLVKDIGAIERALQGLKNEGQQDTEVFRNLTAQSKEFTQSAANIKNKIEDISKGLKTLSSNTRVLDFMVQGTQAFTGAMQIAQGASALFGGENKKLEETLVKLNATMALANGLEQVSNLLKKDGAVVTGIMTARQTAYNFVVGTSTGLLKVLRIALASTGIGALVLGLGLLIANFDKVKATLTNLFPSLEKVGDFFKGMIQDFTDFIGVTSEASRAMDKMIEDADKSLAKNKKFMDEHGDQIDDFTKRKIEAVNRYNEAIKKDGANLVELNKKARREIEAIDKEREAAAEKNRQDAADKAAEKERKRIEKILAERKKYLDKSKTFELETLDGIDKYKKALKEEEDYWNKQREEAEAERKRKARELEKVDVSQLEADLNKIRDESTQKSIQREKNLQEVQKLALTTLQNATTAIFEQNAEARQTQLTQDLDNLNTRKEAELEQEGLTKKEIAQINKKYDAEERAIKTRAWKAEKAAKLEQAIINGALAITNILATMPWVTFGVAQAIAIASSVAATAVQVATIAATKPPKFAEGGSVAKRLGYIDGKPHSAGGELIEVEGNEYVMKGKAVNKYGVDFLDSINNLQMETMPRSSSDKRPIIDYNKLGNVIGQKLNENPRISVNVDKRGVNVSKGGNEIMNNYVSL